MNHADNGKQAAALAALRYLEDGMVIGVGTGSTVNHFIDALAPWRDRLKGAVSSSESSTTRLRSIGIEVIDLNRTGDLELYVDGADETDRHRRLIKGGGGAHLQEKIVATASDQMVVIADISKQVETLGAFPLPLEVIPFGWQTTKTLVEEALIGLDVLGRNTSLRMKGEAPFITDEGNHILDLHLNRIGNPRQLSLVLNQIPGVVENGLFIDICDAVVIGYGDGRVEVRDINEGTVDEMKYDFLTKDNIFTDIAD